MGIISFIAGLFVILILPIMLVMVWVAPHKIDVATPKNPTGKHNRKEFLIGLGGLWLILLIICGVTAPKPDTPVSSNTPAPQVTPAVTPQAKSPPADTSKENIVTASADKTFDITPDEYGKKYVALANEVGIGKFKWNMGKINKGSVNDTFTIPLSEAVAKTGTIDKNGKLKGITYIMGRTDKGDTEAFGMLSMAGLTARVLNPELPKEQTAGQVVKLFTESMKEFESKGEAEKSVTVGNVKYSVMISKVAGLWINFEPI